MSENTRDRTVAGPPPRPAGVSSLIRSMRPAPSAEGDSSDVVPAPLDPPALQMSSPPAAAGSEAKITVTTRAELRDRVRAAYTMTHAQEGHRTFSEFVSALLEREAVRLETEYNQGNEFHGGNVSLPRGRPLGS